MVLSLLIGCNNGGESAASEKGLSEIGKSVENTFYSFLSLIADTLGFRVTAETKKSDVGEHFNKLGVKIGEASDKLEEIAEKAAVDDDKDGLLSKAIKEAVDTAKATLNTLKTHLESLKDIGGDASQKVGEVVTHGSAKEGKAVNSDKLTRTLKALQEIVRTATSVGVKALETGNTTLKVSGGVDNKGGAKILSTETDNPDGNSAGEASLILASVNGEEILESIIKSGADKVKKLSSAAKADTTPLEFAMGGTNTDLNKEEVKAAAVAGGIALRSLVKKW